MQAETSKNSFILIQILFFHLLSFVFFFLFPLVFLFSLSESLDIVF